MNKTLKAWKNQFTYRNLQSGINPKSITFSRNFKDMLLDNPLGFASYVSIEKYESSNRAVLPSIYFQKQKTEFFRHLKFYCILSFIFKRVCLSGNSAFRNSVFKINLDYLDERIFFKSISGWSITLVSKLLKEASYY